MGAELEDAIDQLYAVFARYPQPEHILWCACCAPRGYPLVEGPYNRGTVAVPPLGGGRALRELTDDDVRHFASEALITAGSIPDFLHYLPRLLELMARHEEQFEGAVVARRIHEDTGYDTWPADEVAAVETFLDAWWDTTIGSDTDDWIVESVLCMIASVRDDLTPMLQRWLTFANQDHAQTLLAFLKLQGNRLIRGGLFDAFWEPEGIRQVVDWVFAADTYVAVRERADDPTCVEIADLLESLEARASALDS